MDKKWNTTEQIIGGPLPMIGKMGWLRSLTNSLERTANLNRSVLVCALIAHGACTGMETARPSDSAITSDSAGVRFVSLPPFDRETPSTNSLTELYSTKDDLELFWVAGAVFLPDGSLAIANSGSFEILFVDEEKGLIRRFGRKGAGPGEFGAVSNLGLTTDGKVWVYDRLRGRLTQIGPHSADVSIRSLQPPDAITSLEPLLVDWGGPVLAIRGELRTFRLSGEIRDTVPLLVFGSDGSTIDTIGLWPGLEKAFAEIRDGAIQVQIGFGRDLGHAANAGTAVIGSTDSLALSLFDVQGDLIMKVVGRGPLLPISEAAAERWRQERTASRGDLPGLVEAYESVRVSETYPAFSGLAVDEIGRVWIGEYPRGEAAQTWRIVDRDGSTTVLQIPYDGTVLAVREDRIAVLVKDDLDEESVVVYELVGRNRTGPK